MPLCIKIGQEILPGVRCCFPFAPFPYHNNIFFLLFNSLPPLTINITPDATPATKIQTPIARLAAPVDPRVLYNFSSIKASFTTIDMLILPFFPSLYNSISEKYIPIPLISYRPAPRSTDRTHCFHEPHPPLAMTGSPPAPYPPDPGLWHPSLHPLSRLPKNNF